MSQMLTLTELEADSNRFYLIDVRDGEDYAAGHVTGAVHIPLAELEARAGEIPEGKTPVTICGKGGGRSAEGAGRLRRIGQSGALWLEGGTNGWRARH